MSSSARLASAADSSPRYATNFWDGTLGPTVPRSRAGAAALAICLGVWACATSPLGRRQLVLFPGAEMNAMGAGVDLDTALAAVRLHFATAIAAE